MSYRVNAVLAGIKIHKSPCLYQHSGEQGHSRKAVDLYSGLRYCLSGLKQLCPYPGLVPFAGHSQSTLSITLQNPDFPVLSEHWLFV